MGARAAGLSHLWGIEYDDAIANVARANGFHVITADVMSIDPHTLEVPDVLHASPVCKRASNANQSAELNEDGTKEVPEDIEAGKKIAQFIDVMMPKIFTLENVYAYRNFKAFKIICNALNQGGYMWNFDNLNAADYGVPQTRRRLILRAIRGSLLPMLPQPERWVGWYEAIEDLIPTLPESQFAAWQLKRLPGEIKKTVLYGAGGYDKEVVKVSIDTPSFTVTSNNNQSSQLRAFILDCQLAGNTQERSVTLRQGDAPMFTITNGKGKRQPLRAYLVGTNANDTSQAKIYQDADEPAQTVRTPSGGRIMRAYLVSSLDCTTRDSDEPANTLVSVGDGHSIPPRAYLVESKNIQEWGDGIYPDTRPAATVTTDHKESHRPKAWLSQGRVIAMTPRALARFQSFPDSYLLPDNKALACRVIGNAVPPLLYQKIIKPLVEVIQPERIAE